MSNTKEYINTERDLILKYHNTTKNKSCMKTRQTAFDIWKNLKKWKIDIKTKINPLKIMYGKYIFHSNSLC